MEDFILGNVPTFKVPTENSDLIFQGWEAMCEKCAQPVFFEKSPQIIAHTAALDLLFQWYKQTNFNVKFIFLVRNPMAIMYSAYKLFYSDPNKRQWGWADLMQNMFQFYDRIGKEDRLWVKYEDMVKEPEMFFRDTLNFIGLTYFDDVGKDAHRKSINKWTSDSNYSFQFNEEILSLVYKLGYSDMDIYNAPGKRPTRNHQITFWVNRNIKLPFFRMIDRVIKPFLLKWKRN
jgi:hypothetical protein